MDEKTEEIWSLIAHGLEKQEIRMPLGRGIAGYVAKTGEIVNIPDAYTDPRFNPEVDQQTGFHTRNILCLPIRNKAGKIVAALQLLNKAQGAFTNDDADFVLMLSGHMALAIENAQPHQALLEKERMEKEFALARGIQRSLLPEKAPQVQGFDIAILNEPCSAVGGDYYDFLSLGPHTLLLVIADVEGKGVASALVMSEPPGNTPLPRAAPAFARRNCRIAQSDDLDRQASAKILEHLPGAARHRPQNNSLHQLRPRASRHRAALGRTHPAYGRRDGDWAV